MKRNLTDRTLKALKPAPTGKTYDIMDGVVPGFGVRVSDTGRRTFIVVARYGSKNPTRRALGVYGALTLESARGKARDWIERIRKGIDPATAEQQERLAQLRRRANTFSAVAEDFIAQKLPEERKGKEVERNIRREFIPIWGARPIVDLTDDDVRSVIKLKRQTAKAQARNLLGIAKRIFSWAIDEGGYGIKNSPADGIKPTKLIGRKVSGERILSDTELLALWRATKRMRDSSKRKVEAEHGQPYPYGSVYQLLVLTGLRLNEVADASWREFDLPNGLWTIPAARMKGKNGESRPHTVPLVDDVLDILNALPRKGDYLFSKTDDASSPVWMSDKVKKQIDIWMLRFLRALARRDGRDPSKVELPRWTNHDIRRTVRSGLSRLKVTEEAREAVLAHVRPGIKATYDHHDYLDEKREALELWAARVRGIIRKPPENVVRLRTA